MSIVSLFRSLRASFTRAEAEDINPRVAAGKKAAATAKARYGENYHRLISGKAHEVKAAKRRTEVSVAPRRLKRTPGVTQASNGKFTVRKMHGGVRIQIGTFDTIEKARRALRKHERTITAASVEGK